MRPTRASGRRAGHTVGQRVSAATLSDLTGAEAIAAVRNRDVAMTDIAEAGLQRIAAREPDVHAFAHHRPALVRRRAKALEHEDLALPLLGMTVAVKDLIDTADYPTELGSRIHVGRQPQRDAAVVHRLTGDGALIMGKTVTTEFALFEPGPTTNPLDVTRTPGGSSSGSAAATADRMVAAALGTQTAGSVIRPASFCGVVGFKPSFEAIDRDGLAVVSPSLDTLGIFARTVRDVELVFDSVRVVRPGRPRPASRVGPPRIGFVRTSSWEMADADTARSLQAFADQLATVGYDVVEVSLPSSFVDLESMQVAIMEKEVGDTLRDHLATHSDLLSDSTRQLVHRGLGQPEEVYVQALTAAAACRTLLPAVFGDLDALLTPAVRGEAPAGLHYTGDPVFCRAWTLLHTPTISLPLLRGPNGLPVGVQLVGRIGDDEELLRLASALMPQG